jgi:copper chaperone NosL
MTYQPPLIGSKQLLNFHATSWPAAGGWVAILVLLTGIVLVIRERRSYQPALPGATAEHLPLPAA